MDEKLIEKIENCTTGSQVKRILTARGIPIVKETTQDVGCFSIWLDDLTRIYKPYQRHFMKVQKWQRVNLEYSGAPMFSARNSFF